MVHTNGTIDYGPGYWLLDERGKQVVSRLEGLGTPALDIHCSGLEIWVCPYFMTVENTGKFADYCTANGKSYKDITLDEKARFSDSQKS